MFDLSLTSEMKSWFRLRVNMQYAIWGASFFGMKSEGWLSNESYFYVNLFKYKEIFCNSSSSSVP